MKCINKAGFCFLSSIQILKLKYYEGTFLEKGSKYRNLFYISRKLNGAHLVHTRKIWEDELLLEISRRNYSSHENLKKIFLLSLICL